MSKKVNLYVVMHKESDYPKDKTYIPIQVNADNNKKFTKITDNKGTNISKKNPSFCELTALYWIWKNVKADIVGLVHYRRYFFEKHTKKIDDVLKKDEIINILKDYDLIVPTKTKLLKYKNVKESYCSIHNEKDWNECRAIIKDKFPDYLGSFDKVGNSNKFYACNMFVSSKKIFDKYSKWLFNILFELEKRTDTSEYDSYNKRIYGFLSERLFNVWLEKNNYKVKEMPVYNTEGSFFKQYLEYIIKKIVVK